jgi:hypothetical protein
MDAFLNGTTVRVHPGWMSGEGEPRLLTADELVDMGYGLLIVGSPEYDPETQDFQENPTATRTFTYTNKPPLPTPTLSPRQIRFGLLSIGITEAQVDAALAGNPAGMIEWKYASYFKRDHALVAALAAGFGLSSEQVDSLWQQASEL